MHVWSHFLKFKSRPPRLRVLPFDITKDIHSTEIYETSRENKVILMVDHHIFYISNSMHHSANIDRFWVSTGNTESPQCFAASSDDLESVDCEEKLPFACETGKLKLANFSLNSLGRH